jgi:hypothetical protein
MRLRRRGIMDTLFAAAAVSLLIVLLVKLIQPPKDDAEYDDDAECDFELLTRREQLAAAKETADAINDLEQMQTDIECSNADDILMLHIEWIGRDGVKREHELYCDGINTGSECMIQIAERGIHDMRQELAYQCGVLSERGRSAKNSYANGLDTGEART